jgi:hypothetical protein
MPQVFKKGNFITFRATTKIHLGSSGVDLGKDDVVQFDGQTLILDDQRIQVPALKGAFQYNWLVPVEDTETNYIPRSSQIKFHSTTSPESEKTEPVVIHSEERDMGPSHKNVSPEEKEGVEVLTKKFKIATNNSIVIKNDQDLNRELREVENLIKPDQDQVAILASDSLETLLEAASTGKPERFISSSTDEESDITERHVRRQAKESTKKQAKNKPQTPTERALSTEGSDPLIKRTSVGIDWDLGPHWRKRALFACQRYGKSKEILESIKEIEQPAVINAIDDYLENVLKVKVKKRNSEPGRGFNFSPENPAIPVDKEPDDVFTSNDEEDQEVEKDIEEEFRIIEENSAD